MPRSWMQWPLYEGFTKTASRLLQKYVGIASGGFAGVLLVTLVIGAVQIIGGLIGSRMFHGRGVRASGTQILGGVCFGIGGTIATVLGVLSFTYLEADVGVTTFLVSLGIIPGAVVDRIFFGQPLRLRQWLGIALFLIAGYAMLDFPSLTVLAALPPWVWLTLGIPLVNAGQEGIVRGLSFAKAEPLIHNFWVGLTTTGITIAALTAIDGWSAFYRVGQSFWIGSVAIGVIVIGMTSFMLLAYKGGGSIALKKLIMQATYLVTATMLGWVLYAEPLTFGKFLGMAGYILAFAFMDAGTWDLISHHRFAKRAPAR